MDNLTPYHECEQGSGKTHETGHVDEQIFDQASFDALNNSEVDNATITMFSKICTSFKHWIEPVRLETLCNT